jgi:hypothetical protein
MLLTPTELMKCVEIVQTERGGYIEGTRIMLTNALQACVRQNDSNYLLMGSILCRLIELRFVSQWHVTADVFLIHFIVAHLGQTLTNACPNLSSYWSVNEFTTQEVIIQYLCRKNVTIKLRMKVMMSVFNLFLIRHIHCSVPLMP